MVLDLLDPLSLGKYIQQMFSRGWLQGVLSSRHSFPLLSKPTGFAGTPATLSLVVRNLWIQEWPPAATVQCNWSFSDLWLAAWGGTPQKAKAQLKIEVESVHLNISSSRKRPQSFIGRLKLTSTLCQFFGWGFFFFLVFHIMHNTCPLNSKNNILSQQLPGKNMRWKNQSNVFP